MVSQRRVIAEKPLGHIIEMEKWLTACLSSRTLAQYSTDRYAGRLYFRVRNGTGCDPAAMAVIPKHGISGNYIKLSIDEKLNFAFFIIFGRFNHSL